MKMKMMKTNGIELKGEGIVVEGSESGIIII